jgi:alpha-1,2-mannosyltransferase
VWRKLDRFLVPRRLHYAGFISGATWMAWLASILLGPGNLDLNRQVVGPDYLAFYAVGETVRTGQESHLYDFRYQHQMEAHVAQTELVGLQAYLNPPFLAWLFVPFSALPYRWSFTLWSLLGLALLWASVGWLGAPGRRQPFAWALTFFPVFASISFGQNGLLSVALFSGVYLCWRRRNTFCAGVLASLLLYKPQLLLALGLLWLLEWRRDWRALMGLLAGGVMLVGLTFMMLPESSQAYIALSRTVLPNMAAWEGFPLHHAHMLRAFFLLLLPGFPATSEILALLCALVGVAGFLVFWKQRRASPELLFSAVVCLTIWITPHAMIYDWALLLVPAVLLWESQHALRRQLRLVFSILWLAILLSGMLTTAQQAVLPVAVQISLPVFGWAMLALSQILSATGPTDRQELP